MRNCRSFRLIGGFVLLGGCAADVSAVIPPDDATGPGTTATANSSADRASTTGELEAVADYDPFAGDMPDLLVDAHMQVLAEQWLDIVTMRALVAYAEQEPSDARPWLLLALDAITRDSPGFAVRYYRSACEADPEVVHYARMLDDLLTIAIEHAGVERSEAVALIAEMWGDDALPAIDALMMTLHEQGDLERARALAEIRTAIAAA